MEEKLIEAGVSKVASAIDAARSAGVDANHVADLISFWAYHKNGWDDPPTKLYFRVCNARPTIAVDAGWATFRAGYKVRATAMTDETAKHCEELDADDGLARILAGSHSLPPDDWREAQREAQRTKPRGLPRARVNLLAAQIYRARHMTNGAVA